MVYNKFEDIAIIWKEDKRNYVKLSTHSAYSLILHNHLIPYFKGMNEINESIVQEFVLKKIGSGLNEKTVKDILIVLKMVLKFGVKKNLIEFRQIDIKFPISNNKKDIEILSNENQKKLFKYLKDNFTFKNLGIIICLTTGMRIGEICALRWSNIDIIESVVKVRCTIQRVYINDGKEKYTKLIEGSPKTKESIRDIPLSNELIKILKPLLKFVNKEYYVISNLSSPIEPRTYRKYYQNILKKLDLPNIKFHGLRHSFATRCIEASTDYKTISSILGHSNISTTLNLYVHPNKQQKKKCIDKMMKLFD